jgi:ATP-dependent Clp protease ATP-binding subunit ClpX
MYHQKDVNTRPKFVEVNTQNILFIAGGAFDGIERIISKRLNRQAVGYSTSKNR